MADKELKEEPTVQVLTGDENEVEEANDGGEKVTGGNAEEIDGEEGDEEYNEDGDEDDDDDDDDDEEEDEEEEDLGTEYLVKPVGEAEDDEDASDFEPDENGLEEDIDEEDNEEEEEEVGEDTELSAGKSDSLPKRKRVAKDDTSEQESVAADDVRPSKR